MVALIQKRLDDARVLPGNHLARCHGIQEDQEGVVEVLVVEEPESLDEFHLALRQRERLPKSAPLLNILQNRRQEIILPVGSFFLFSNFIIRVCHPSFKGWLRHLMRAFLVSADDTNSMHFGLHASQIQAWALYSDERQRTLNRPQVLGYCGFG